MDTKRDVNSQRGVNKETREVKSKWEDSIFNSLGEYLMGSTEVGSFAV